MKRCDYLCMAMVIGAAGCAGGTQTAWPPPLDRELLEGTWVQRQGPVKGVPVHNMLHLDGSGTWLTAEISGDLAGDAAVSHVLRGRNWQLEQLRWEQLHFCPTSVTLSKDDLGKSAGHTRPVVLVSPSELDFGTVTEGIIMEQRYRKCPAEVSAALVAKARALNEAP